jgi:hypothetical protein
MEDYHEDNNPIPSGKSIKAAQRAGHWKAIIFKRIYTISVR